MYKVGAAHKPRICKFRENQLREIQEVPVRTCFYLLSKLVKRNLSDSKNALTNY